jgi:hypothetical protein
MTAQDAVLRWGEAAAEEFGYARPSPEWAAAAVDRIGPDVMSAVLAGVASGDVELIGPRFRLPALGREKGPYAWFSRSARGVPAPNWEYFVQVATWLQVRADVPAHAVVGFEDGLMDVSVRVGGDVVWCVEVKERAAQLQPLLRRLVEHGRHVDLESPDRHDDPLRKAKYVVLHRPQWFSLVAGDGWFDHDVEPTGETGFVLRPVTREHVLRSLAA